MEIRTFLEFCKFLEEKLFGLLNFSYVRNDVRVIQNSEKRFGFFWNFASLALQAPFRYQTFSYESDTQII